MNHYELLCIVSGSIADSELPGALKELESLLVSSRAVLHYTQPLERRKLAYPINHQTSGTYVLIEFDADSEGIRKIDRDMKLHTNSVRHIIVKRKTVGAPRAFETKEQSRPSPRKEHSMKELDAILAKEGILESEEKTEEKSKDEEKKEELEQPAQEETKQKEEDDQKKKRKKDEKLQYEDLDKKLDEILRDDIL